MTDPAVLGAIAGALITGVIAWFAARSLEARRRRDVLAADGVIEFVKALAESALGDPRQARIQAAEAKAQLVAFAPREIVEALLAFERAGSIAASPRGAAALRALIKPRAKELEQRATFLMPRSTNCSVCKRTPRLTKHKRWRILETPYLLSRPASDGVWGNAHV